MAAGSGSVGTTGNGLVGGGGVTVGSGPVSALASFGAVGRGAVAVPDPPPEENEIEPPALYPPLGGGPSVTGFGGGAASFSEMRRLRASTVPMPSAMASTTTTAMTIQIQVGTGQS